jgi:hypothetical protein
VDDTFDQRAANEQAQGQESEGDVMVCPFPRRVAGPRARKAFEHAQKPGRGNGRSNYQCGDVGIVGTINGLTFRGFAG